jgi:hypothetical protein
VYTLAALVALLAHLARLLRGGRRPPPAAPRLATAHPGKVRNPD